MTSLTHEEVERIASKLSKAQERHLRRLDERVWSLRELPLQTWGALFDKGLIADVWAADRRFFALTDNGLAVRTLLLEKES